MAKGHENITPGNPGNKGGTGRPPNEIRRMSRESHAKVLELVNKKLTEKGADLTVKELTELIEATGKYGVGTSNKLNVGQLTAEQIAALAAEGYLEEDSE